MFYGQDIAGGLLLGLASALPLLWEGRIAGVSGYASTAVHPRDWGSREALVFVMGLLMAAFGWRLAGHELLPSPSRSLFLWALSGFLVGAGARRSGGCTSGHGICGLGRLSRRSLAAVAIFMLVAVAVRFFMRSVP